MVMDQPVLRRFSFFLVFLVEAGDAHVNSILLLDEPGTSLHGTA